MQSAQANHMKIVETNWGQDIELRTPHLRAGISLVSGSAACFWRHFMTAVSEYENKP
jgi:hypothetical protein